MSARTPSHERPLSDPRARKMTRAAFDRRAAALRTQLLGLQDQLKSEDFSVVILFAGSAVAGKNESLNLITEWMDPRWIVTRAYGPPSDEERSRPEYWRYWRDLPPRGRIGLFVGSWYHRPIHDRVYGHAGKKAFHAALDEVCAFERTLAADGTLVLKFLLHLDKAATKKRMKAMEKNKHEAWRIGAQDWSHLKHHNKLEKTNRLAASYTNSDQGPWIVIDGADPRGRAMTILTSLRTAIAAHIKKRRARRARIARALDAAARARQRELDSISANLSALQTEADGKLKGAGLARLPRLARDHRTPILDQLDMTRRLTDNAYESALKAQRAKLGDLCRRLHFEGKAALILFEGPDAAGKGGAIRRLTASMDARDYRVIQVAAPTEEERAQHYLWRFWRHVPQAGRLTIFDRSWYGRVLVERVERFSQPDEWARAYDEINDFERQVTASGIVLVKFWIHISADEQLRRFKERETISYKKWKLTPEDWRNREKWDDYGAAVDEMVARTSTTAAPWTLVEGNDKKYTRIKVMDTVCDALRRRLKNS